jgi:hypothetical protein
MMSLDLCIGIEKRFGVELPIVAISPGVSVNDLATRLIAGLRAGKSDGQPAGEVELQLLQHGAGAVDLGELMALTGAVKARSIDGALL